MEKGLDISSVLTALSTVIDARLRNEDSSGFSRHS